MGISNNALLYTLNILDNFKDFLSSLTIIDVIFFFSVVLLMVLIVTLLYFIKLNEDIKDEVVEDFVNEDSVPDLSEKISDVKKTYSDEEEGELIDLASITKALENKENEVIDLTAFEEEQEKDAIISYDELIKKSKTGAINYKSESMLDDLSVKEVDINNLIDESSNSNENDSLVKSGAISYQQEEAFLSALKKLQQQLN